MSAENPWRERCGPPRCPDPGAADRAGGALRVAEQRRPSRQSTARRQGIGRSRMPVAWRSSWVSTAKRAGQMPAQARARAATVQALAPPGWKESSGGADLFGAGSAGNAGSRTASSRARPNERSGGGSGDRCTRFASPVESRTWRNTGDAQTARPEVDVVQSHALACNYCDVSARLLDCASIHPCNAATASSSRTTVPSGGI